MPDYLVQVAERSGRRRRWGEVVTASSPEQAVLSALDRLFGPGSALRDGRIVTHARRCPVPVEVVDKAVTGPVTVEIHEQSTLL